MAQLRNHRRDRARADAIANAVDTVKLTGGSVEIAGVRIEPCDEFGQTETTRLLEQADDALDAVRAWAVKADEDGEPCAETVLGILDARGR